jgi:NADH:ubiquinone oxidoreductase subunit 5 (subunit L)/multisubunit Na+/H+ antiporter MnhA subunit
VRVFTTYRLCDVGLLIGVVLLHVLAGTTDFAHVFGAAAWPGGAVPFGGVAATMVALCFGLAAAGKSAQLPVGNWLARAMEGPTPSSALFYGGPAVHAGIILLMRLAPVYTASPVASAFLVVVGLGTALHATLAWRVQTDQKSALAFATMTQLGLIVAECGLGLWTLALAHTVAHVCLRTFQQLRAPSALHDAHVLRATNQGHPLETPGLVPVAVGGALLRRLYALGLSRSHLDELIDRWVVDPVMRLGTRLDAAERRWFDVLGQVSRAAERADSAADARGVAQQVRSVLEEETP